MPRPKVNSNFFKTWSYNMAYILGFIATDGCLVEHKNGYNGINITSKNKEILDYIAKSMDSNHKIGVKLRGELPKTRSFQIQIRDKVIYTDLLKLGFTPRKSKTIRLPEVPREFLGDFVRGCFDGDGSINVWQDPRWRNAWQTRVAFSSGSRLFLSDMQKCLYKKAGLGKGNIQSVKRAYLLCYSIADSVKLYNFMYHDKTDTLLYLENKRNKFEFFKKVRSDVFKKMISN